MFVFSSLNLFLVFCEQREQHKIVNLSNVEGSRTKCQGERPALALFAVSSVMIKKSFWEDSAELRKRTCEKKRQRLLSTGAQCATRKRKRFKGSSCVKSKYKDAASLTKKQVVDKC